MSTADLALAVVVVSWLVAVGACLVRDHRRNTERIGR